MGDFAYNTPSYMHIVWPCVQKLRRILYIRQNAETKTMTTKTPHTHPSDGMTRQNIRRTRGGGCTTNALYKLNEGEYVLFFNVL